MWVPYFKHEFVRTNYGTTFLTWNKFRFSGIIRTVYFIITYAYNDIAGATFQSNFLKSCAEVEIWALGFARALLRLQLVCTVSTDENQVFPHRQNNLRRWDDPIFWLTRVSNLSVVILQIQSSEISLRHSLRHVHTPWKIHAFQKLVNAIRNTVTRTYVMRKTQLKRAGKNCSHLYRVFLLLKT